MDALISTYVDEWEQAVRDPELRKQFRQFANTVSLARDAVSSALTLYIFRKSEVARSNPSTSEDSSVPPTGRKRSRPSNSTSRTSSLLAQNGTGFHSPPSPTYNPLSTIPRRSLCVTGRTLSSPSSMYRSGATLLRSR